MDSHIHHHQSYQQQNQPSSGLLRFRSAPSSLLSNLTPSFVSEDFGSSSFRELQGNNNKGCSKDLSSMNSHKGVYGGGLPPHYPRHGSSSSTSSSDTYRGRLWSCYYVFLWDIVYTAGILCGNSKRERV